MKKKYVLQTVDGLGKAFSFTLGGPIKFGGRAINNEYIQEIGDSVSNSTRFVFKNIGGATQGVLDTAIGLVKKDKELRNEGLSEVGGATWNVATGMVKGVWYTSKNMYDVATGVVGKDQVKVKNGLKNIGKVGAVLVIAYGVFDVVDNVSGEVHANVEVAIIETINADLDGTAHPESGVHYETSTVQLQDGTVVQGVFPVFESVYNAELPEEYYESSSYTHVKLSNDQLYEAIHLSPELKAQFSDLQLEQIYDGETPDGYTWHHHEQPGKMQLMDTVIHAQSGHTGGMSLWGGGY
ncbi:HNH endonuclease [Alkalihalobacterium sp. APHAB7]|uniref:HNH endonuclease n=1 Tax=Alkalihalobacterium sp. APHAB7 TaxID=3402081 RepID=UPI003AAB41EA